jgi:hypothetical protein
MGHVDAAGEVLSPFVWDGDRRLQLCAKLDALYFSLYGAFNPAEPAQSRDDIRYIYSTFDRRARRDREMGQLSHPRRVPRLDQCTGAGQPDGFVAG